MRTARVRGPGHSDQACDMAAASIVEEYVRRDTAARLQVHVSGGRGALFVAGEVISTADFDVSSLVRRVVGSVGSAGMIEPFIAFEPLSPHAAPVFGGHDLVHVSAFATDESVELVPSPLMHARTLAREIERRRTHDPHWFWLGADYDVHVFEDGKMMGVVIRTEHTEQHVLLDVRTALTALVKERFSHADIRVNPGGEEICGGLAGRMGSSDRSGPSDGYGSHLPCTQPSVGLHPSHPSVAGTWMARQICCELVLAKHGKAVMAHIVWLPLETRPQSIRLRNERGEDLTKKIDPTRFDLSRIPEAFLASRWTTERLKVGYDESIRLPWEGGIVVSS